MKASLALNRNGGCLNVQGLTGAELPDAEPAVGGVVLGEGNDDREGTEGRVAATGASGKGGASGAAAAS